MSKMTTQEGVVAKRTEERPSSTHYEKEGHDEENRWKLYLELRPKRNDKKEKQKKVATVQQDQEFE